MAAIETLRIGRMALLGTREIPSGIAKHAVQGALRLTRQGLVGDEQADRRFHGGPEKALHHYPAEHYPSWRAALPQATRLHAGGFGENISTRGMDEGSVAVGDIFRIGSALVQVSQGRQPCWKLNDRFGVADMAARVQASGRTGWYYRVLEEGIVSAGDRFRLVDRPTPDWLLSRIWRLFYVDLLDRDGLAGITTLSTLSESWRSHALRRLETGEIEDWSRRLTGPLSTAPFQERPA